MPDLKDPSVAEALRSLRLFFGRDLLGWSLQGVAESSKNLQGSDEVIARLTLFSYLRGPSLMTFEGTCVASHLFLTETQLPIFLQPVEQVIFN